MSNRTIRSFSYGIAGVVAGIVFLAKGVPLMGVPSFVLGACLLALAINDEVKRRPHAAADKAAAKAYRESRPKPFTPPRAAVGDLAIIEKVNSTFWLATVASVDRQSRVATVTTGQGARMKLSWLRGNTVRVQIVSADVVDVADAMRREVARSQAKQEWTSRDEVRALLVRAKSKVSDASE
ncbi:MAG TPA: hypothetical protein VL551_02615 [Actinospica sp.]|jgi:hypothetical protein|nr:hypothetical protein [Actinospica sp.]